MGLRKPLGKETVREEVLVDLLHGDYSPGGHADLVPDHQLHQLRGLDASATDSPGSPYRRMLEEDRTLRSRMFCPLTEPVYAQGTLSADFRGMAELGTESALRLLDFAGGSQPLIGNASKVIRRSTCRLPSWGAESTAELAPMPRARDGGARPGQGSIEQ